MSDTDGGIVVCLIVILLICIGIFLGFIISTGYYDEQVTVFIDYIDMLEKYDTIDLQSGNITLAPNEIIIFGEVSDMRMELGL